MYIEKHLRPDHKVLHLAPERGIYQRINAFVRPGNYIVADFAPKRYPFAADCREIDLTRMEDWPSNEFDLIIHVHVLEHIPCNIAYPLFHLHRMLTENGTHMFVVPFLSGTFEESLDSIGGEERAKRFGQDDHVRKFGRNGISLHLGSIVRIPETFDATLDFTEELLREYNIPEKSWKGFTGATVLALSKNDYRLR
jgi:phosphoglycolate phosphatase